MTFLVIALLAGLLGFWGLAGIASTVAQVLFFVFLVLFVIGLIASRRASTRVGGPESGMRSDAPPPHSSPR